MVVDSGRLAKIHTTSVSPRIKPLHAGHWEHRGSGANAEMGPIAKCRRFGPQIRSVRLQIRHFPGIVAKGEKYFEGIGYTCWYPRKDLGSAWKIDHVVWQINENWKITWKYPRAYFTYVEMSVDIQSLFKKVESRTYVIMYPNVLDLISYFLVENFDLFLCKRSPFTIMLQRAPSIGEIATQSFGLVNFLLCCSFHRTAFPFPRRWCHRSSCCTAACSSCVQNFADAARLLLWFALLC